MEMNKNKSQVASQFLAPDYWKWLYTSRHLHYFNQDILNNCLHAHQKLTELLGEINIPLSQVILEYSDVYNNKYLLSIDDKIINLDSLFSSNTISKIVLESLRTLTLFSEKFGYLYEDIYKNYLSKDLLDFYLEYNYLPFPPVPFPSNKEQVFRIICYLYNSGFKFDGQPIVNNKVHIDEYIDIPKDKRYLIKLYNFIEFVHDEIISKIQNDKEIEPLYDYSKLKKLNQLRKIFTPDKFIITSNISRILGLYIFEYIYDNKMKVSERTINKFFNTEEAQYLCSIDFSRFYKEKDFFNFEGQTLLRLVKQQNYV